MWLQCSPYLVATFGSMQQHLMYYITWHAHVEKGSVSDCAPAAWWQPWSLFLPFWAFDPLPISAPVGIAPEKDAPDSGHIFQGQHPEYYTIWSN